MRNIIALLSFCSVVPLQFASAQQLLTNGEFEIAVPSNATGGGWTSSNIDSNGGHRATGGNPNGFFILNHSGGPADPTIEQVVTGLTLGATYEVSGDYRSIYTSGSSELPVFEASIDGSAVFLATSSVGDWTPFTGEFTAANNSALLAFAAELNGNDLDFAIDNVSVTMIPEPATVASILGIVSLGLILFRRGRG